MYSLKKSGKIKSIALLLFIIAAVVCGGCSDSAQDSAPDNASSASSASQSDNVGLETQLTVSKDEEFFTSLRDDGNYEIIVYEGQANIVNVPEYIDSKPVVEISGSFLRGNENVVEVNISDKVEEISEQAFSFCDNLEKLTMGKGVQKIGESLCMGCGKLKEVELSPSLTEIPLDAFSNCTSLEKITIPDSVTKIDYAFPSCSALKEVHIPASVEFMGVIKDINSDMEECNIFEGSPELTIYAPEGSYAEEYANKYGISFEAEQ